MDHLKTRATSLTTTSSASRKTTSFTTKMAMTRSSTLTTKSWMRTCMDQITTARIRTGSRPMRTITRTMTVAMMIMAMMEVIKGCTIVEILPEIATLIMVVEGVARKTLVILTSMRMKLLVDLTKSIQ